MKTQNHIAGRWCDAAAGDRSPVVDPADDGRIADVPDSRAEDALAAVDAAQAAFEGWRAVPARQRAALLKRWNDLILRDQDRLGALISQEQGKPLAEGRAEIAYAASYVEWFAEEATRANGEVIPAPVHGRRMLALRERSLRLTGYLEALIRERLADTLQVVTPREPERRGAQLSLRVVGRRFCPSCRALFEHLESNGIVGDWREPDVIRISPAPLYNSHADILRFVRGVEAWRAGGA